MVFGDRVIRTTSGGKKTRVNTYLVYPQIVQFVFGCVLRVEVTDYMSSESH